MAWLLRRINPFFSILLFISCFYLACAQQSVLDCIFAAENEYRGLGENIITNILGGWSDPNPMAWCPLWAALCGYFHRTCPTDIPCEFVNSDPKISAQYDPSSPTNYLDFLGCDSCSVQVSLGNDIPFGAIIPSGPATPTNSPIGNSDNFGSLSGILAPGESPNDVFAESPSATSATRAVTTILIVGSIVGSLVAAKTISTTTVTSSVGTNLVGSAAAGGTTTITNPKTGSGSGQSVIDAVTLLLHFQSVSTSGLLSISYPALYRFFSYNFAWANLLIVSNAFTDAARSMGANPSCLSKLGSLSPGVTDAYSPTGMTVLGLRYGLDRAALGGLVYLTAIVGVAVALAVTVLVNVVLHILNNIFSGKLQDQIDMWPSRASSMSLRLFIWVFGSVSTFAVYQFANPCSSASLTAFASVEFVLIILTLLTVSILIIKTAKSQGSQALFQLSESEESRYSRKWGSLYTRLKPDLYWYFIPDYVWVFAKSIIVGVGQGSGIAQVGALIGLESVDLLVLMIKQPYAAPYGNTFHISSAGKRLFTSFLLLVFWEGFSVPTGIKRNISILLIFIESVFAVALFVVLLVNGGMAIMKWNTERKERKRDSVNKAAAMTSPLTSPDSGHYTNSYFSNTSPVQEKF